MRLNQIGWCSGMLAAVTCLWMAAVELRWSCADNACRLMGTFGAVRFWVGAGIAIMLCTKFLCRRKT